MGCGASGAAAGEVVKKEEAKPQGPTLASIEPEKFKLYWEKMESLDTLAKAPQAGAWISDTKYVYILGDNEILEHPVEMLDVSTMSVTQVATFPGKQYAWPTISASPDGSMYALAAGATVGVFKADHSEVCTITSPCENSVCNLAFSPDGKKIAFESGDQKSWVYSVPEAAELMALEGEKSGYQMIPSWYDNDTLLSQHAWFLYAHTVSTKAMVTKWEIPKGSTVSEGIAISKSKKIFVANDEGIMHELTYDGAAFALKKSWRKITDSCGPQHVKVFSDELTFLYENYGGGHFQVRVMTDEHYETRDDDEWSCFKYGHVQKLMIDGKEDGISTVKQVRMNNAMTFMACPVHCGLKMFTLTGAVAPAAPAPAAAAPAAGAPAEAAPAEAAPAEAAPAEAPAEAAAEAEKPAEAAEAPAAAENGEETAAEEAPSAPAM